eukprot:CAMPEP_0172192500 /NCGR_PEP_ID=MMETSP1050-20130122/24358_1 /TAXON_ID=233186 /ORGANISM="Cryptomonas curvata, Strain CCAP979/52" /LENGTH=188 /DNA_ID=CAMNT_0012867801 /DNA_START=44 /DNA_END=610 /DNA_ORIENTATION=+
MFWYSSVKPPPPTTTTPNQPEALVATRVAKDGDIFFGQESDIELMDTLGNEFEDEETSSSLDMKMISDDRAGSTRSDGEFPETVCDYSPLLSFSFKDSWNSEASQDSCILDDYRCTEDLDEDLGQSGHVDAPKHQQLRLVDGRLQVVGFNADCHDRTTSRTTKLRRAHRKRRNAPKPFWSELMYYLSK